MQPLRDAMPRDQTSGGHLPELRTKGAAVMQGVVVRVTSIRNTEY